jgi:Flp pilus assembly protein TadG
MRQRRGQAGQELVEYALVFPFLALLILGIAECGLLILAYGSIGNAAREGARYGTIHPADAAGIEAAARLSTTGLDQGALRFTIAQPSSDFIRVEADYDHSLITAPVVAAMGGGGTLHLRAVATMQTEQ